MYVIRAGRVAWLPAVNVHRIITTAGAVSIAYLFARAWAVQAGVKAAGKKWRRPARRSGS